MIALISDIHGNLDALERVLADIDDMDEVERIYCLGDVVGYGPQPRECLDLVVDRCSIFLMGNHESAVVHGALGFRAAAREAIDWTREVLYGDNDPDRARRTEKLLKRLPVRHQIGDVLLVHGSPRDPVMEYVLESDLWEGADPDKMDQIFSLVPRLCFVGHSHRPGVFTEDHCFLSSRELGDGGFAVNDGAKYVINVGSVGQPRDHDPRACYLLYTGDAIYHRRVAYDIDATAALINAVPQLGERQAIRLYKGE